MRKGWRGGVSPSGGSDCLVPLRSSGISVRGNKQAFVWDAVKELNVNSHKKDICQVIWFLNYGKVNQVAIIQILYGLLDLPIMAIYFKILNSSSAVSPLQSRSHGPPVRALTVESLNTNYDSRSA